MLKVGLLLLALIISISAQASTNTTTANVNATNLSASFTQSLGYHYLLLSFSSYCTVDSLSDWSCRYCTGDTAGTTFIASSYDANTDTRCFVAVNDNLREVIVSFKGTNSSSITDWIDDLNIIKTDQPFDGISGAYVHSGFYNAYMAHKSQIFAAMLQMRSLHGDYKYVITGHSLGGAMATLCALDLIVNENFQNIELWTYGSPRVGNPEFSTAFGKSGVVTSYRNTHSHDIVPHLPPELLNFHHVATEVWNQDSTYTVCNGSGEDPNCSNSIIPLSVSDHLTYFGVALTSC